MNRELGAPSERLNVFSIGRMVRARREWWARRSIPGAPRVTKANECYCGGARETTSANPESPAANWGSGGTTPGQFQQGRSVADRGVHTAEAAGSIPAPAPNFTASRSDPKKSPASPRDPERTVHVHAGERRTLAAVSFYVVVGSAAPAGRGEKRRAEAGDDKLSFAS